MTEHEKVMDRQLKFRIICDTIWYDDLKNWSDYYWGYRWYKCVMSEKDMIFTQEFMEKFTWYYHWDSMWEEFDMYWKTRIFDHLDNPVSYLYNLLVWHTSK